MVFMVIAKNWESSHKPHSDQPIQAQLMAVCLKSVRRCPPLFLPAYSGCKALLDVALWAYH